MYQPKKYSKNNSQFIFNFIRNHPFATIVSNGKHLLATHVPVLMEGTPKNFRLYFHIANHNEQIRTLPENAEILLIFQGAHGYVSSSWYTKKDISTWDYSAVHVNATITPQTPEELEQSLKNLVQQFENQQKSPLFYNAIPQQILQEHLPLITGFWAEPFKTQGIGKWHQGASEKNIQASVTHLEKGTPSEQQLARDIKKENNSV